MLELLLGVSKANSYHLQSGSGQPERIVKQSAWLVLIEHGATGNPEAVPEPHIYKWWIQNY